MNKELNQLIDYSNPMGSLTAIMAASKMTYDKLPEDEKKRRKEASDKQRRESVRRNQILQNICPTCGGRLARGKKNRKNDYKRDWVCIECDDVHSL